MIPSLKDPEYALSSREDVDHLCYKYNLTKTFIYRVLRDELDVLKEISAVGSSATLSATPVYKSSFTDKVYIFGYYIASAEFDNNSNCFHNWPWGEGTDQCKYHPDFSICDYTVGDVQVKFNFNMSNPRHYFIFGDAYNDNNEESIYTYNGEAWLHQVNWGGKGDVKYGVEDYPKEIDIKLRKTWSVAAVHTWMAIDADSLTVNGHENGNGLAEIDREESPDVLESITMEKGAIDWPIIASFPKNV